MILVDHVISGMQTQYCVDIMTRAFSEGYKVTLVSDAIRLIQRCYVLKTLHHNVVFGAFADVITLKDLKETVSK